VAIFGEILKKKVLLTMLFVVAWDFFFNKMANSAKNYHHKKITQIGVRSQAMV
jgi:hypothetical protein